MEHTPQSHAAAAKAVAKKSTARAVLTADVAKKIVIFSEFGFSLVLTYALTGESLAIGLEFDTPVTDISLGSVTLDASDPRVQLGGSFPGGVVAEVTLDFEVSSNTLTVAYDLEAPFLGPKKGSESIHV